MMLARVRRRVLAAIVVWACLALVHAAHAQRPSSPATGPVRTTSGAGAIVPFRIQIADTVLLDLKQRLSQARFAEGASLHTPGRSPLAGDHVGRDAAFAQFGRYMEGTGGTFKAELQHVLADDDGRVVAIHHNSGLRNGKRFDVDCCIAFQIRNGRLTDGREFFYDVQAWDGFWS